MSRLLVVWLLAIAAPAMAAPVRGLVYDDRNGDGRPSIGEPGIAGAVVAFGIHQFVVTDAHGGFELDLAPTEQGIVWVRVPDGFVPGPVWGHVDGGKPDLPLDLGLRRLAAPHRGPITFVVTADTHVSPSQPFGNDLAQAIADATALDPPPAFVTILGDVTQGAAASHFELVDRQLAGLAVPYIPVPGNHDWYDGGAAWFAHYGPDNYSFDIDTTHFVVWNLAMSDADIRDYLGAELSRVPAGMAIVALTHAPPDNATVDVLRSLGVDYVLTGHAHTNRVVDHDGVIELNTEPFLMGGLDFTPGGYRVMTIDRGKLGSYHRTVVERPLLEVIAPGRGQCVPATGGSLLAAAEYDAGDPAVTARVDCATPIALRYAGGWGWQAELPALAPGPHTLTVNAHAGRAETSIGFAVCDPGAPHAAPAAPAAGDDWPQLGGTAAHTGARDRELAPPVVAQWATAVGGHILQATPVIAGGTIYITATDQGDGNTGGVIALDLATGAIKWRTPTAVQIRGGAAVAGTTVAAAQVDGTVLGLDAATGAIKWRNELGAGVTPGAAVIDAPPAVDDGDFLIGNQHQLAAMSAAQGAAAWTVNPVPQGQDSEALSAVAVADGVAFGVFNRALGGIGAWDRMTGSPVWRVDGAIATAINASPVVADGVMYGVNGMDEVFALDAATGDRRWLVKLDPAGFDWGNATAGTPALAKGVLVVPTLYHDLVALDAMTGMELWRHAGAPSPVRSTHYRGAREAGFEASPVVTGDLVWAADTAGTLAALDLHTGAVLWQIALGTPVLGGLAVSGDWLVVASYDGAVRAFAAAPSEPAAPEPIACDAPAAGGCCDAGGDPSGSFAVMAVVLGVGAARRRRRA
ncbi:MAG TPA: PQQ-binding-like beta-propeller repeat protein [Kofleriaceae bacterium]|nr:PQQ-binding-like beta-propeller repeat protein [Kofleriaceae bacterium]